MLPSVNGAAGAELDQADQRRVLLAEIADWKVARYQFQVRHRVAKAIGDPQKHLDDLRQQLERCERAIDALHEELRLLEQPQTP